MKHHPLAVALSLLLLSTSTIACTTILVGNQAAEEGGFIMARNEDNNANTAKHFLIYPHVTGQKGTFKSHNNNFTYPLPTTSLSYTGIPDFNTDDKSVGEAGFNEMGVGMSATETIYNSQRALKADPYVVDTGITEDAIENVVLPRIHTARQGVEVLGKIIEHQGAGEGFGVAFVDAHELWYLETGSGHQWMATQIPRDQYFVSANQGRLKTYIEHNRHYMASPTLVSFAQKQGWYNPKQGPFDFHLAYFEETDHDKTYNYPRVWTIQHLFNPKLTTLITEGPKFSVFLKPEHKISVADVAQALRNHYQGTPYDPYTLSNPHEPFRPIAVFRAQESHILQVRPHLPKEIGEVEYVAIGMPLLSVYIPYYQGIKHYLPGYDKGTSHADSDSVNWKYRKLQTLVMQNYPKYAPAVEKAYIEFEQQTMHLQQEMEKNYLSLYRNHPQQAQELLQAFEDKVMQDALSLTDQLTNQVFTQMTYDTDQKYHFEGA